MWIYVTSSPSPWAGGIFEVLVEGPATPLNVLQQEAGLHVFQRVPPTERRGRVHTSSLLVAVLALAEQPEYVLRPSDLQYIRTKEGGPGGQHQNKTESCVIITHLPTCISVKSSSQRSQHRNKDIGLQILAQRVQAHYAQLHSGKVNLARNMQIRGSLSRVKTYRFNNNQVTNHITGQHMTVKDWGKGRWE